MLHPAIPLGGQPRRLDAAEALLTRVRLVLETRPGRLPWRPDFGCDLASLAGQPASGATLQLARTRVEAALRTWVPEVQVRRCEVRLHTDLGLGPSRAGGGRSGSEVPLPERALLRLGASAWLDVELELLADTGPVALTAALRP